MSLKVSNTGAGTLAGNTREGRVRWGRYMHRLKRDKRVREQWNLDVTGEPWDPEQEVTDDLDRMREEFERRWKGGA